MGPWLTQLTPGNGVTFVVIAFLALTTIFLTKQIIKMPKKKGAQGKALLKELLEGFGLEVPAELNEQEVNVIKQIETP